MQDFVQRVNSDLVNKLVNIASRCAKFITQGHNDVLAASLADKALWQNAVAKSDSIAQLYEQREYGKAMREIMSIADEANRYIDEKAPWTLAKEAGKEQEVLAVCSMGINLFRLLMIYLKPVLPATADAASEFLNAPLDWAQTPTPLLSHKIEEFKPLMKRADMKQVAAMLVSNGGPSEPAAEAVKKVKKAKPAKKDNNALAAEIDFDTFAKVDLRVAKIISAAHVEGADKLLCLQLDLGELGTRQVFSGIKSAYSPEQLTGKLTVMAANLAPRKMKFGISEGMVLAAGPGDKEIWLLEPDSGAQAGMRIM
jgi:methionyl-tRNA synthetase